MLFPELALLCANVQACCSVIVAGANVGVLDCVQRFSRGLFSYVTCRIFPICEGSLRKKRILPLSFRKITLTLHSCWSDSSMDRTEVS